MGPVVFTAPSVQPRSRLFISELLTPGRQQNPCTRQVFKVSFLFWVKTPDKKHLAGQTRLDFGICPEHERYN
jgi:hypothetical protein